MRFATCHPDRKHYALGLCHSCYMTTPKMRKWHRSVEKARRDSASPRLHRTWSIARLARKDREYGVVRPKQTNCAICGVEISGFGINRDHDHRTNRFRGWLCRRDNTIVGYLENLSVALDKYLEYINATR